MNLSNLTSAHFRQVISLLEKKEALQAQIADLERQAGELLGETSNGVEPSSRRAPRKAWNEDSGNESGQGGGGGKRGALKESIIGELKNAGEAGISVKELADKLNVKSANLHAWFGSTGKKLEGIQKIGPAKYSLSGTA